MEFQSIVIWTLIVVYLLATFWVNMWLSQKICTYKIPWFIISFTVKMQQACCWAVLQFGDKASQWIRCGAYISWGNRHSPKNLRHIFFGNAHICRFVHPQIFGYRRMMPWWSPHHLGVELVPPSLFWPAMVKDQNTLSEFVSYMGFSSMGVPLNGWDNIV